MATQVQWRRGTTTQNNTYTGAIGEITVDTTLKQLRLHDGATAGGTIIGSNSITVSTATNLAGGTAGQIPYQTAAGATSFFGAGAAGTVLVSYGSAGTPTFQNTLTLAGTTAATSTQTGALVVGGGVGIGGNLYVGGEIVANRLTIQLTTVTTTLVQTDDIIQTLNTTQSSSTITGALQVAGGAGIGLDITVGGSIRVASVVTATTFIGNLTGNITGAGTGNLHYQSANNTTSFLSTGTAGQLLVAAGGAPVWTNTTSIYVNRATLADIATTATSAATAYSTIGTHSTGTGFYGASFNGSANQTWSLNTSTLMTTAVNIVGGLAGSLPYQTAAGATTMLGLGTNGFVLTAGATAPQWTAISGLSAGLATTATNLAGGNAWQIPYQTAPGLTAFANSGTTGQFWQANTNAAPTWTTTASMYVGNAVQAETIKGGGNGSLLYQSAASTTSFLSTGTPGQLLMAAVGAPAFTNTASIYVNSARFADELTGAGTGNIVVQVGTNDTQFLSTGTTGQLLVAAGGVPVFTNTSSISVGYSANILGVGTGGILYESANNTTSILSTGTPGQLLMAAVGAPAFTNTASIYVNSSRFADNLTGGGVGSIPIQSAAGTTAFIPLGTSGYVLTASATTATWQAVSGLSAGRATTATNLDGGTPFQIPYQTAPGATAFANSGTTGQFWQANTNAAPTWTNTSSMYVNDAVVSTNIRAGTPFQIPYQSAANTTAFASSGTTGQFWQATTNGAPTWTTTANIYVANAAVATNVRAGTAGQLVYQSAASTTAFISTATTGNFLQSNFAGAPTWTTTANMYVAAATQVNTVIQTANASYFPTFVDSNNATAGAESFYTTSSFQINPSTGLTSLAGRLAVNNADASTTTNTSNALYVAGGAWINKNLTVAGDTTFQGSVVFQGTNTFVYSSSTVYTDNLISLHAPSGSGPGNHTWTVDDGKDIGFMFHYYKTVDKDAFLGFDNDTTYLEWYDNGTESGGVFTGTSYGTFRTGAIKLVGGAVNSGNTSSGDLTVLGGVGIGNNLYVAGNITVGGTINASITGVSTTATNIAGGVAGQLHVQSAPGVTTFAGPGSYGQFLMSTGASAPVYQSTITQANGNIIVTSNTAVSTTNSGALQVVNGGVGIGGGLVVGNITTITNTTNASSTTTGALQVVGGVGIGGNIYFNGNLYQNGVLFTSGSTSTTSTFTISNTTQSTSTTTGALVVAGGFGLGGNFYSGGTIVNLNGTNATSTTTGALQIINGGAGIGRDLWVGGSIYVNGAKILPTSIQEFTATGGQTTFTVSGGYTVGSIQVFANGVQLANADFTASNGTTVVVTTPRVSGDIIRTVAGLTSSSINNINSLAIAYSVAFGG